MFQLLDSKERIPFILGRASIPERVDQQLRVVLLSFLPAFNRSSAHNTSFSLNPDFG